MSRAGTERDTHRIWSRIPSSELSAQSPTRGSNSWSVRSWPERKSDAQPTEPPRRPIMFVYSWERERQSVRRGGAEREGDIEAEAGSKLWAVSTEPNAGLKLTDCKIMTWAEVGCSTDWATQAPPDILFYLKVSLLPASHLCTKLDCKLLSLYLHFLVSFLSLLCLPLKVLPANTSTLHL